MNISTYRRITNDVHFAAISADLERTVLGPKQVSRLTTFVFKQRLGTRDTAFLVSYAPEGRSIFWLGDLCVSSDCCQEYIRDYRGDEVDNYGGIGGLTLVLRRVKTESLAKETFVD